MNELVVLERLHHEQGEVDPWRAIAREDRIAHVLTPHREPLALALFEIAATNDRPPRRVLEHPPAGFDLIVNVGEAEQSRDRAEDREERPHRPGVHILPVTGDVPATGKNEARSRLGEIEDGLRRARRELLPAKWNEDDQHAIAARDRSFDDFAFVRRAGHDSDAALELVQPGDAVDPADGDDLGAARVPNPVSPELPRGTDDADLLHGRHDTRLGTCSASHCDSLRKIASAGAAGPLAVSHGSSRSAKQPNSK